MDEMVVPVADDQLGFACHAGVNGIPAEKSAEDSVVGIGRQAADRVAGVDVAHRAVLAATGKVLADALPEVKPDILQLEIARGVPRRFAVVRQQILAGALGLALAGPRRT